MKEQRVTIEIGADGRLAADAEGFRGDTCMKELESLLDGLAAVQISVDRKPRTATAGIGVTQRSKVLNTGKREP